MAVKEFNAALLHALYPAVPRRKKLDLGKEAAELMQDDRGARGGFTRELIFSDEPDPVVRSIGFSWRQPSALSELPTKDMPILPIFSKRRVSTATVFLYVSLVCPVIQATDKAKSSIVADRFKTRLFSTLSSVLRTLPKPIKAKSTGPTDKELMRRYLRPAYDHASSKGKYLVMARQLYYPLRDFINIEAGVTLSEASYNAFTQKRITEFFEEFPEYENKILFERRGSFKSPFGGELLLGTADVAKFVQARYDNKVKVHTETKMSPVYDFSPKYLYNRVLFVEKGGYRDILEEAGLLRKLNMGIMSTQGFGTRAERKWSGPSPSRRRGVRAPRLRHPRLPDHAQSAQRQQHLQGAPRRERARPHRGPGATAQGRAAKEQRERSRRRDRPLRQELRALPANRDSHGGGKEVLRPHRGRDKENIRPGMEKARHYYKRVEINALTSEELIVLIEREILRIESEKGLKQPEPSAEELRIFLSEIGSSDVLEEIKKRAIYEVFRDRADVSIDPEAITRLVLAR